MEYIDILDEQGNNTGRSETRINLHKQVLLYAEVCAFLYKENGETLLQKRSSNKKMYRDCWSITGGHVLS